MDGKREFVRASTAFSTFQSATMNLGCIGTKRRLRGWPVLGLVAVVTTVAGGVALWWLADHRRGLRWARAVVHDRFPDVPQVSPGELAAWLQDAERVPPMIWDVRSTEEHQVSHLRDAVHVPPETPDAELRGRVEEGGGRPILCYCAAGYRGAEMARRLRALKVGEVYNLAGGIFHWANESHEVVRGGERVTGVHAYHTLFSRLLRPERRVARD